MKNFTDYTINKNSNCLTALQKLDSERSNQTLFVIDEQEKMIGTVTDGDIRRGLIRGLSLDSPVHLFCYSDFSYIYGAIDVSRLRQIKKGGLNFFPDLMKEGRLRKYMIYQG